MFNEKLFRMALLREEVSLQQISKLLGINLATLYRKMRGDSDFYRDEIQQICDFLHLELKEKEEIFFDQKITETQKGK
ncbi:MAG: hypothetical protein E7A71_00315 [Enterococcus faecium]|nr:hypothetical protein [Enterococcus faecium]